MKKTKYNVNRRQVIKASSAGLAASAISNVFPKNVLANDSNIKRVIVWFVTGGATQQAFWPTNTGPIAINPEADIEGLSPKSNASSIRGYVDPNMATYCLQPLQSHVNDISLYSGFSNQGVSSGDPHGRVMNSALTGSIQSEGSFDQILAPHLQGAAPFPSIYLPVYGHHALDRGANHTYMSPARRVGGGSFGSPNWNPMETYNELFPDGISKPNTGSGGFHPYYDAHLIALKKAEVKIESLKCQGGTQAQTKLNNMLAAYSSLRSKTQDLLNQLDTGNNPAVDVRFAIPEGWRDTEGTRSDLSKYWNQSDNFGRLVDIAIDTTVAAFGLDKTRVSLLQFSSTVGIGGKGPVADDHYRKIGIPNLEAGSTNELQLGHSPTQSRRRNHARIARWYYGRLAYLIERLKSVPEGDGSLFDNTLILTTSDFGMYNDRSNDLPYIVAGGKNINMRKGVYEDVYESSTDGFRRHSDLFLGVAHALGVNLNSFGTSTTPYSIVNT